MNTPAENRPLQTRSLCIVHRLEILIAHAVLFADGRSSPHHLSTSEAETIRKRIEER